MRGSSRVERRPVKPMVKGSNPFPAERKEGGGIGDNRGDLSDSQMLSREGGPQRFV